MNTDPDKVREWKRRSQERARGRKPSFAEALQRRLEKSSREAEKPARARGRLKPGRRMKEWARAWNWLKPRLEAAGRTRCEFDHLPHVCSGILTPAHSKKRREMEGDDIYAIAIACTNAHQILDERLNHEQMEVCVMYAIERAGGPITPAIEAAKKERHAA